jgi:HprK-related kinase A
LSDHAGGPLSSLSDSTLHSRLAGDGLRLRSGPLVVSIGSQLPSVARNLALLYADHAVAPHSEFADFHVRVETARGLRRLVRRQAQFEFDGILPFSPLPHSQAFAMLEWGLNWVIASQCHQYLIIHAAVIERDGFAAILPAPPGSGKSTLCAGLIHRGWRLCSDELTLLSPHNGEVVALSRPVNLKNQSIDLIRAYAPEAVFGEEFHDTHKGRVAHLRPPKESVQRAGQHAQPRWIVFPRWEKGAAPTLRSGSKAHAFIDLADNAFNYSVLGETGFATLGKVIDDCECLNFTYDKLDDAVEVFDRLVEAAR